MQTMYLTNLDQGLDLRIRHYESRSGFLRAVKHREGCRKLSFAPGGVCYHYEPEGIVLPQDIWLSPEVTDRILIHEVTHAVDNMYNHLRRRKILKDVDHSEFRAYLTSGIYGVVSCWALEVNYNWPEGGLPESAQRALWHVDQAYAPAKETT